jgi:hypothetical protein
VAKLTSVDPEEDAQPSYFGCMAGAARITGDIMAPLEGGDWEACLGEEAHFHEGLGFAEPRPDNDKKK